MSYVDDIIITSTSSVQIHKLIESLHDKFSLKRLGCPEYVLGIEIKHLSSCCLFLSQAKYIRDILNRAIMNHVNGVSTPMLTRCKLNIHGVNPLWYPHQSWSIVIFVQYVTLTWLSIEFNVIKSCQFMDSHVQTHSSSMKRILRYLSGIIHHGFLLSPDPVARKVSLRAYSDSN